jgi:pimeloyl-ACP methyl ester carboxylesterase
MLSMLQLPGARLATSALVAAMQRLDTGLGQDAPDLRRVVDALPDATSRAAFIRTLRGVVDWRGQVVTMLDRCYLVRALPTLLVWGTRDSVLPIGHAYQAHAAMPGSRLEVFEGAGHFPFRTDPARFVTVLEEFLATTTPSQWGAEGWRDLLRAGRPAAVEYSESSGYQDGLRAVSERSAT